MLSAFKQLRIHPPKKIWVGLLMLVSFLLLDFYLLSALLAPRLENFTIEKLQDATGLTCRLDGAFISFPLNLKLYNLQLIDNSGQLLLSSGEVRITPKISALLSGKPGVSSVSSIKARNVLVRGINSNNKWIFPRLKTKAGAPDSSAAGSGGYSIKTEQLSVAIVRDGVESIQTFDSASFRQNGAEISGHLQYGKESMDLRLLKSDKGKNLILKTERFSLSPIFNLLGKKPPMNNLYFTGTTEISSKISGDSFHTSGFFEIPALSNKYISSSTIENIKLRLELTGYNNPKLLEISSGKIYMGNEPVALKATLSRGSKTAVNLELQFNEFSYERAIAALPKSLYPELDTLKLTGGISGLFSMYMETANPKSLKYSFEGRSDIPRVISLGKGIDPEILKAPFIHTVRRPDGSRYSFMVGPGNPDYTPLTSIPNTLKSAVIISEDGLFFSHNGFSRKHIHDSIIQNLEAGRFVRGASTISMQLAKNLYLTGEKSIGRKFQEAIITMALEQSMDKKRMLEIYLNIAEWGNNIYGVAQASGYYFGKPPSELLPEESAFLASILPNPRRNWKQNPLQRISSNWLGYIHHLMCLMYRRGDVTLPELRKAGVPEEKIRQVISSDSNEMTIDEIPFSISEEESVTSEQP